MLVGKTTDAANRVLAAQNRSNHENEELP
jgi:hypothetical protein